jgi:hypothetical protein
MLAVVADSKFKSLADRLKPVSARVWVRLVHLCIVSLLGVVAVRSGEGMAEDDQRLYRSAYYLGRGDTGLAIADDAEAIMYNPAGIAQGKGIYKRIILASPMLEASDDARNLARELSQDSSDIPSILRKRVGKNEHIGAYNLTSVVLRRAAIGVFNGQTSDILIHKSVEAGGLEGVKARVVTSNGAVFAVAQDFFNQSLLVGANLKYMHRGEANLDANVTDAENLKNMQSDNMLGSGMGTSSDIGVMWKIPGRMETSIGATVHNVGGAEFTALNDSAPAPKNLKQLVNFGIAIQPGTRVSRFRLLAEYWDATNELDQSRLSKIHLGGELSVKDVVGVTAGLSKGWSSGGIYLDLYALRFDAGIFIQEAAERVGVRPDKRLFFRITAGL